MPCRGIFHSGCGAYLSVEAGLAGAYVSLCSTASNHINGTIITADGECMADKLYSAKIKTIKMQIRYQNSPEETSQMNTQQLRQHFLIQKLMVPGSIRLTYSHYDRMIVGGAVPVGAPISLPNEDELKAKFSWEKRNGYY